MKLRLHHFLPSSRTEGPGLRACLWVQGCPIHCAGCAVPWTWSFEGGDEIEVEAMAELVLAEREIEGITFLGGEPFSQAAALAALAQRLRGEGLSIMTFSGYTIEALRKAQRADWNALLDATDLLIDGPFRQELVDASRPWVGSKNQRYHFLTETYRHLESDLRSYSNGLEIRVRPDGRVELNGLATQEEISQIIQRLTF
jgi:anaerobic ribonucleoside-triphosphate reductase activating protein